MQDILSRHRLPAPYRLTLALLWLAMPLLLAGALLLAWGPTAALLDLRLWGPLMLLLLPPLLVWQQGVDVCRSGLVVRLGWPRYHAYGRLSGWRLHQSPQGAILQVWDRAQSPVLQYHAAHLSDLPLLARALHEHLGPMP